MPCNCMENALLANSTSNIKVVLESDVEALKELHDVDNYMA